MFTPVSEELLAERIAALEREEFTRRMSYRATEESLDFQQEDLEQSYADTHLHIQVRYTPVAVYTKVKPFPWFPIFSLLFFV